ncbi:MAG: hypothetical protein ACTSQP_23430 [Promethearchaeota archaeon]
MDFDNNSELEYYIKILEIFENNISGASSKEVELCKLLIQLLNECTEFENQDIIKNALIISLSFLNQNGSDFYDHIGRDITELKADEKEMLLNKLRKEFNC